MTHPVRFKQSSEYWYSVASLIGVFIATLLVSSLSLYTAAIVGVLTSSIHSFNLIKASPASGLVFICLIALSSMFLHTLTLLIF